MTRDDVKKAADILGRIEGLESALRAETLVPHGAFPVSFFDAGEDDDRQSDDGVKVYYPREAYFRIIHTLLDRERADLRALGVEP